MSGKKISVIMSTYNEKEIWIKEAIDSILNQTINDFEFIIIVDKPDNNKLISLLKQYELEDERIKIYINDENLGLVKSLNKALNLCTGRFIARMDADDFSNPQRFEKQLEFLENNPEISLCATGVIIMDEEGGELYKAKIYGTTPQKAEKSLIYRNIFPHGSWMFRKEILGVIEGYKDIDQAEDYDLLFRMISNRMKLAVLDEYLFKYRLRMNGISYKNLYKQKKIMLNICEQYKNSIKTNREYILKNRNNEKLLEKEIKGYSYYQELYTSSISQIRNKKFLKGSIGMFKALIGCKYKRLEIKSSIALKIIENIY